MSTEQFVLDADYDCNVHLVCNYCKWTTEDHDELIVSTLVEANLLADAHVC